MKKDFEIVEDEDGIILYDESDDFFGDDFFDEEENPSEYDDIPDESINEYLRKVELEEAHNRKVQMLISVGVVLGCVLIVALFAAYAYWRYL